MEGCECAWGWSSAAAGGKFGECREYYVAEAREGGLWESVEGSLRGFHEA